MSKSPIEFWFDFSSGYAYFAASAIEAVATRHGHPVIWRPYMLGVAFKRTSSKGLSNTPMKGDYARHDWARLSKITGMPFHPPSDHPITALPATRAYYWAEEHFPELSAKFARRAFHAYFAESQDMKHPTTVAMIGKLVGLPQSELESGINSASIKEKVKSINEEALAKGVFGSPFFLVDSEPFWGWDRIPMLERWLDAGTWHHSQATN